MRVKCPSCGKVFDIPKAQEGKMMRCLCRSLFRAKPTDDIQDIADIAEVSDPEETIESQRKSIDTSKAKSDEDAREGQKHISEDELDNYLDTLKKSRSEVRTLEVEAKAKNSGSPKTKIEPPAAIFESPSLELSSDPRKVAEIAGESDEKNPITDEGSDQLILENAVKKSSERVSGTQPVVWYKDFRVLAAGFAMILIVLVGLLTLLTKKEEKKIEDPYLTQLLKPSNEPAPAPKEVKENHRNPTPPPKAISVEPSKPKIQVKPMGNSLYDRLLKEFYEGRFENVVRLASSAKDLGSEERALHFEALVQRANDNRPRLQEIKSQINEERKRTQAPVFLRSIAAAMIFSASETKELLQAIEILKNLAITRSRDALIFVYLGFAYHEIDRPDLMNQAWNDATNMAPGFTWLIEQRIDHFLARGNFEKASEIAEHLRALPGKEQRGLVRLAKIAIAQNQDEAAMKYYREALKIEEDAEIHLAMGQYQLAKNPKAAIKEFDAGLSLDPDTLVKRDLYFNKAKAQCKQNEFTAAMTSFNKSVALDAHFYPALFEKGNCQLNANQAGAAAEAFEAALQKSPNNSTIWMTYGYTLLRLKKMRAAVGALRRSLDIKESDKAHYYMALALIQLGKRQEGIGHAKQAYKLNPKNKDAKALALRGQ